MRKIVVISPKANFRDTELVAQLEKLGAIFYEKPPVDLDTVSELFDDDEKILMIDEVLTKGGFQALNAVLPRLRRVTCITNLSARYHEVDLKKMAELGIIYCNNPNATTESVAELAIMDLFALVRNVPLMQRDEFEFYGDQHLGREVSGLSVGIVGYGNIGARIAALCAALGMPVKICSRTEKTSPYAQVGLLQLLDQDVLFISLAADEGAQALFNEDFYGRLRPDQYIVDITATDSLYDKNRLIERVNQGKLAGYAFEAEKPSSVFASVAGNILITPHVGWGTQDSYKRLYGNWVATTISAYNGQPRYVVSA